MQVIGIQALKNLQKSNPNMFSPTFTSSSSPCDGLKENVDPTLEEQEMCNKVGDKDDNNKKNNNSKNDNSINNTGCTQGGGQYSSLGIIKNRFVEQMSGGIRRRWGGGKKSSAGGGGGAAGATGSNSEMEFSEFSKYYSGNSNNTLEGKGNYGILSPKLRKGFCYEVRMLFGRDIGRLKRDWLAVIARILIPCLSILLQGIT